MADNVTLNPGTAGDACAADDITDGGVANGAKTQRVKAGWGTDNNYKDPSHTNPFPVANYPETAALSAAGTMLTPKFAIINAASSGSNTIVAGVASKKIRVLSYMFVCTAAVTVQFKSSTTSNLSGAMDFGVKSGAAPSWCPLGLMETVAGEALTVNLSAAVQVSGQLTYVEV